MVHRVKTRECFWGVALTIITFLACQLTWLLYNRFQEMPTRITIENQYESIWELPHPAVTICSPSQITISAMKHFNRTLIDGHQNVDLKTILPQLLGFYHLIDDLDKVELANLQSLIDLNRYTAVEVMGSLAQDCNQFFKQCIFQAQRYPCADLFKPILTKHGLCCIFNGIYLFKKHKRNEKIPNFQPRLTKKSGFGEALTVVVDFDPEDAIDATVVNAGSTRVMVHDWTEFPADDESRVVSPETESFHMLHATYTYCSEEVTSLPIHSRKCYFEDEKRMPFFKYYHNSDCDLLCFVKEVQKRCHCTMIYMPHLRVEEACNVTSIACIVEAKNQMSKWYRTDKCDCPRDCISRRYKLEMSVGNLNAIPHMFMKMYPNITFSRSTSILHFFFPNSVYIKQKQETVMSLISLASNLGGVFGLCLGCSFISVLEVLYYIYLIIRNNVRKRLRLAFINHTVNYTN